MTTIKDKPLKKITCDTRVKIDTIHNEQLKRMNKDIETVQSLKSKITELENSINNETEKNNLIKKNNDLVNLKNKLNKYDENEYTNYFLDNGILLSDYYNNNINYNDNTEKKKKTILDIMNNSTIEKKDNEDKSNINQYLSNIDETIINHNNDNLNICKLCNNKLFLKENNSELICNKCGYTEKIIIHLDSSTYKDPIRESTYFAYKRINHFNEWLAQFQAKETNDISEEIINNILNELKKDKNFNISSINYNSIREILKKLNYNRYYEHIFHIIYIITGENKSILNRKNEDILRNMFKDIQQPFQKHCPKNRKNFLSYSYVLHKFCELLELDDFLKCFPYLKSTEKLRQQDSIWKDICKELKWQYIPSI